VEEGWGDFVVYPEGPTYQDQTEVTVTALPAQGYVFDHWEGSVIGSGSEVSVKMDRHKTITAFFVPSDERHFIMASVSPAESGTISLSPLMPAEGYAINTRVTVTARAASGYGFSRWEGSLMGSDLQESIIIDRDKSIGALFNPSVVAQSEPPSWGTVVVDPPPAAAGYSAGTEVTLTATAAEGYRFDRWSGDISSGGSTVAVRVHAPIIVTAHFAEKASFPWWWIAVGLGVFLAAAFILLRVARLAQSSMED
jgi:autotransporter family porin